jgi:serine/threonine protein kinase/tetratricopeptide (TPR) repeat protein
MTEEALFELALNTSEAERSALLDRECAGDPELRARVEALLDADATRAPFLEPPTRAAAFTVEPDAAGAVLAGKYKLIERIGEGGMGSVWLALQSEPVKRKVAVKLIKPGMDSKQILARFEAERQALAMMDHPNIAKVLDGGLTPDNRPFFVMELVKGSPITEFCDARKLTPNERLELFVPVSQAIQHAHQKGMIHRDIKPSNVLIALYDDKPVPKVIDFGVSKATGQQLTEHTFHTGFGGVVGTPQYMSPEQATFNNLDIDTRSDVYSLGILLYELLAGSPPFSKKDLEKQGFLEMLRVVREEEPPKPSTKLSTADALPSLSANRGTEPKKLTALLRNELDWIVLKALEKDRSRRYETANAFAADVQRYLAGEAVLAHPPSATYRFKKFLRKNRGPVIAAALVALALVGGIAGTSLGLVEARKQTNRAEGETIEKEKARQAEAERAEGERLAKLDAVAKQREAEQSTAAEKAATKKAEQAEADTLADFRAATDDAIEQLIGSKSEIGPKEKAYLEKTLKRWQAFASRQGDDERSRAIRGEGHHRVASFWQNLGRNAEARADFQTALEIRKRLSEEFPADPEHRHNLATTYHGLGILLEELGKRDQARTLYDKALILRKELVRQYPAVAVYERSLGRLYLNRGLLLAGLTKRPEAQADYEASLEIKKRLADRFPDDPVYLRDLPSTHTSLGYLLSTEGKLDEAGVQYQASIDAGKKLVERYPDSPDYRQSLAVAYHARGLLLMGFQRWDDAKADYAAALEIDEKLVGQFPAIPGYRLDLARAHNNLGLLMMSIGKREEARKSYLTALDLKTQLVAMYPTVPEYRFDLARSHNNMGVLYRSLGKRDEMRAEYRAACDLMKDLVAKNPEVPEYLNALGGFCQVYGNEIRDRGDPAASVEWYSLAIRTFTKLYELSRFDVTIQSLRSSYSNRAYAYDLSKKPAEAVEDWTEAIKITPPAQQGAFRARRANSQIQAGMVAEAVAEVAELTKFPIWNFAQWYDFACVYALASGKEKDKQTEYADRAIELLRKAIRAGYKDVAHMKVDTDLEPLRDREDFKQLIADLEKKYPPKLELAPAPRPVK